MSGQLKQPRTLGVDHKLANVCRNEMGTRSSEVITMFHISDENNLTTITFAGSALGLSNGVCITIRIHTDDIFHLSINYSIKITGNGQR